MTIKKESPKQQELGPKRYKEMVERENKFYDNYKAGKRDPKTGQYYNPISFSDPRLSKVKTGGSIACVPCVTEGCENWLDVKRTTRAIICRSCKKMNSWTKEEVEQLEKDNG